VGNTRRWRRGFRAFRRAPGVIQVTLAGALGLALCLAINWSYQVARKPSELFFPVSGRLYKTPEGTWQAYGWLFRKHATAVVTPELLAALAQVEASGNPVARTYWRFDLGSEPFEIYRPASSAVGMYQITDATFAEARRYCIHFNAVAEDGPWYAPRSCWFNGLYSRVIPSHAIELTSAYLDRRVAQTLDRQPRIRATLAQKQRLATLIHLCGAGAGARYARAGFRLASGQRCGDHRAELYLAEVAALTRRFARLAAATRG
jgi:hypothetical protein